MPRRPYPVRGDCARGVAQSVRFFGHEPELWLNLQTAYDLAVLRREKGARIEAEVEVAA